MIRFPAEWEPQSAVLIAWPHRSGDFSHNLENVEDSYRAIAEAISDFQNLLIVCKDESHQLYIQQSLDNKTNRIHFIHANYNDIWVRDTVFLTVTQNDEICLQNFLFNGWGGKYPCESDNALNDELKKQPPFNQHKCTDIEMVLEGGSIESDGHGTLLTTRQCLLNKNRNPKLDQSGIESNLLKYLGAKRLLWIDQEHLPGDDTDAHIDTLARFCSPDSIAYTACNDASDQLYASLKHMEEQLKTLKTVSGKPYKLFPLELPKPIFGAMDNRLPANYANFLILNEAVLVPGYEDPNDAKAVEQLTKVFPNRQVISVPCKPIVQQYGSLHCMTMQFPAGVLLT